jgi:hypothetical protein
MNSRRHRKVILKKTPLASKYKALQLPGKVVAFVIPASSLQFTTLPLIFCCYDASRSTFNDQSKSELYLFMQFLCGWCVVSRFSHFILKRTTKKKIAKYIKTNWRYVTAIRRWEVSERENGHQARKPEKPSQKITFECQAGRSDIVKTLLDKNAEIPISTYCFCHTLNRRHLEYIKVNQP